VVDSYHVNSGWYHNSQTNFKKETANHHPSFLHCDYTPTILMAKDPWKNNV
jgi:hypothetical protein